MLTLIALGCRDPEPAGHHPNGGDDDDVTTTDSLDELGRAFADAFRIDLSEIDVTFDWTPDTELDGRAVLTFTMRPGEVRPLFHFVPYGPDGEPVDAITAVDLDGESLDLATDLRTVQFDGSWQKAHEIQRDVDPTVPHTLTIDWSIPGGPWEGRDGWLLTHVDDIPGRGQDRLFPTINSPEELARHKIELRVHSDVPYTAVGSAVEPVSSDGGVQVFALDTIREVSSYTVLLDAIPSDEVTVDEFEAGGVPVRIVSNRPADVNTKAHDMLAAEIPQLEQDFGPFPMPSLQVFLFDWSDGEEYYGATNTGIGSLFHEIVHMYLGCSLINRAWRDTWIDEALNDWYNGHDRLLPLPEGFHSGMVGGRSPIRPGFDDRAYGRGAQIMDQVATSLGGDQAMIDFLRDLHDRRSFAPYTTDDFLDEAVAASGDESLRDRFQTWLYTP